MYGCGRIQDAQVRRRGATPNGARAAGICCQKVGEAEAMVLGGVNNVLVTNQIVGATVGPSGRYCPTGRWSVRRRRHQRADLNEAALSAQSSLNVLVEINVGAGRCGVSSAETPSRWHAKSPPHRPAVCRVTGYQGSAQHKRMEERRDAIDQAVSFTRETVELLERNGLNWRLSAVQGRHVRTRSGQRHLQRTTSRLLCVHGR